MPGVLSKAASGSSHLSSLSFINQHQKRKKLPKDHPFHILDKCRAYPGLSVMNERYERDSFKPLPKSDTLYQNKDIQRSNFFADIKVGQESELLLVLLSNDYKCFITDDSKNKPFSLRRTAHKNWKKLTDDQKTNYCVFYEKSWTHEFKQHIMKKFDDYRNILLPILKKSCLKKVFHSSVLERVHFNTVGLDIYFAILNSVLKNSLQKWSEEGCFKNRYDEPIEFEFVNVSDQFHSTHDLDKNTNPFIAKNEELLPVKSHFYCKAPIFISKEIIEKKELVHRTPEAINKLATTWSEALSK